MLLCYMRVMVLSVWVLTQLLVPWATVSAVDFVQQNCNDVTNDLQGCKARTPQQCLSGKPEIKAAVTPTNFKVAMLSGQGPPDTLLRCVFVSLTSLYSKHTGMGTAAAEVLAQLKKLKVNHP